MSEENLTGKIEITIDGDNVSFSTNMSVIETHWWLAYVSNLIVTGQAQSE